MRTVFALLVCAALCSAEPETVYIEQAQGLLLIGSFEDVVDGSLRSVKGLHAADVDIPGGVVPLEKVLNPIYLDQPVGPETISQLKQAIATYYRNYGRPIVSVLVPEQDVTDGVLQLVVTEGRVGKVSVEGNRWFSSERLEDYMSLKPDEFIDEDKLIADLGFINRNPFRRADVIYAPGEEPGQTDIRLLTADRFPLRVFAGGENSGVYATGRQRWVGGFVWANAWGLDHVMSFQYSTSANFNKFQSYSGSYEIPLPWKHAASISGGFSEVHATIRSFRQMANHGNSAQISGRYRIPMRHRIGWEGELSFGADWKRTNNTVEFGGLSQPVIAQNANLFQIAAAYSGGIEYSFLRLSMDVEIFGSPFEFLPNQSTAVYDALVPGANVRYLYGKSSWAFLFRLPQDFSFSLIARGQLSSGNLLPMEQYGIGGYNTVRGYEERQLNYEQALLASAEFRTPAIGIIKRYKTKINDGLQLLAFCDWGWGSHHTQIQGSPNTDSLAGAGAGARYSVQDWLTARLDLGYQIRTKVSFTGGPAMLHFAVMGSY